MTIDLEFTIDGRFAGRVVHAHVDEALSEPYDASVILALSTDDAPRAAWLGRPGALAITGYGVTRFVRGVVIRQEELGRTAVARYVRVRLEPLLALLAQRSDVRVFQETSAVDIVREVLREANAYTGPRLVVPEGLAAQPPREYCVQFRESDAAFVRRLLEEEGVAFAFEHDDPGGETLVLSDHAPRWPDVPIGTGGSSVSLLDEGAATATEACVERFSLEAAMRPTGVTLGDFDFTRPQASADLRPSHPTSTGERAVYDHPGPFHFESWDDGAHAWRGHDGARQARIRYEALQQGGAQAVGTGFVVGFRPGAAFSLTGADRETADARWLLTRVTHEVHAWSDVAEDPSGAAMIARIAHACGIDVGSSTGPRDRYRNRFSCVRASDPWRPERGTPRPLVHGIQTATVVGPPGEDVATDAHGRVRVRFHWDRSGRSERSSCWVRVAQIWAGAGFGGMFVPRVGMEVVVSFIDGDPDRPLITGCVYNGVNRPPWALPEERTRSGIRTASSPRGGFNEFRFEDRLGEEQVHLRAERDLESLVRRDRTLTVQRNDTVIVQGREKITVGKDRVARVQGNDAVEVALNQDIHVQGPLGATLKVDETWHVIADRSAIIDCGDARIVMQPGSISLHAREIRIAGGETVDIKAPLVRINCSESAADGVRGERGGRRAALAGSPDAGVVGVLRAVIDHGRMKAALSKVLGSAIARLGLAPSVERALRSLGDAVVGEVTSAASSGRRPQGHRVAEQALASAVNIGVDQVFAPLASAPAAKAHKVLAGVVREARDHAAVVATHAAMVTADVHAGMSKDSAWHLVAERHGAGLRSLLGEVAAAAADVVQDAVLRGTRRGGAIPRTDALVRRAAMGAVAHCLPTVLAR